MTINKKFKARVRERMALTGENYTTARRALEGEYGRDDEGNELRAPKPSGCRCDGCDHCMRSPGLQTGRVCARDAASTWPECAPCVTGGAAKA